MKRSEFLRLPLVSAVLALLGLDELEAEPTYDCERCRDRGVVAVDVGRRVGLRASPWTAAPPGPRIEARPCPDCRAVAEEIRGPLELELRRKIDRHRARSGVPQYWESSWETQRALWLEIVGSDMEDHGFTIYRYNGLTWTPNRHLAYGEFTVRTVL